MSPLEANAVHPRLRGELSPSSMKFVNIIGSSPLTRGTPGDGPDPVSNYRFIPAYAGNSLKMVTTLH